MTDTAIAADFDHSLDIHGDFTAKVTFYGVILFDFVSQLCYFFVSQILCAGIRVDTGGLENQVGGLSADTVNIGQSNFNALRIRNIYTSDTCQSCISPL